MNKCITKYYNNKKTFGNNNENIKTIGKDPLIKISILSTITYLHHCSEYIIHQYPNVKGYTCTVKHWKRMIT